MNPIDKEGWIKRSGLLLKSLRELEIFKRTEAEDKLAMLLESIEKV